MKMSIKKGLGKGLGALLSIYEEETPQNSNISETKPQAEEKKMGAEINLPISQIRPNPNQPRKHFDEEAMLELAESIKQHGVIQPIIVTKQIDYDTGEEFYMIVAGERRYRSSKLVGLTEIPCIIKDFSDRQIKEIALVENLQREDLNPIEASRAIKQLIEEYHFTQEIIAQRIGKNRTTVTNLLRLLNLQPEVISLVEQGKLPAGHARALVPVLDPKEQIRLANYAVSKQITTREMEKMVKELLRPNSGKNKDKYYQSPELTDFIAEMQRVFATKVSVIGNDNKGRIYIDYFSKDDLDRIYELVELIKNKKLTLQDLSNFNKRV